MKPNGWYRTLLKNPKGHHQTDRTRNQVHAICTKSEGLKDAIDRAYLHKYNTPGALEYAKDSGQAKSRATTLELGHICREGSTLGFADSEWWLYRGKLEKFLTRGFHFARVEKRLLGCLLSSAGLLEIHSFETVCECGTITGIVYYWMTAYWGELTWRFIL